MPLNLRLATLLSLLLPALFWAQTADAACAVAPTASADIGARTSYDIRSGGQPATAVPPTLTCNGSLLSLVSTDYATATVTSANGFRLRGGGGDSIGYRLSADSAGAFSFTQGGSINYLDTTFLGLLGILSASTITPPMFVAPTETPNLPAGTYTDTVTINWQWAICRGIGALGVCVLQERGSGTTTLTVSVTVTKDCRIVAPPVSFGSAPLASRFATVTQAVAIDCTRGATFSVSFSAGTSGASRPWRQMRDGAGHALRYNLYWPDGTTIWDDTSPRPSASAGTGATTPSLLQTYVARIDPAQATPPVGSYTDTVSVVVSF